MDKTLNKCKKGKIYTVSRVNGQADTKKFLGNLGCVEGERIMIISKVANNFIVNILSSRYGIDENIAKLIEVK